ncbi:MAG TPA: alpha/beta fold hydrolase [Verrucomicrobiae bacterium]|nr:alpha/beta fold hydrolase [Verrucomicrobiae bacterium]
MRIRALALLVALVASPCLAQQAEDQSSVVAAAKEILQKIAAGQFDAVEARYTPQMSAALAPGRLASVWASILEQEGSFQSIVSATETKAQSYEVVLLACKFDKAVIDAQVALTADGRLGGLRFTPHREPPPPWVAPAYAKPDAFTEQPLTLVNGKYDLPGTLTLPKGKGPFAAIVLVQGSGPHDQDETIGPNKPLEDLAWGLATQGIAVYRYTKRTQKYGAQSSDDPAKLTVDDETMSDARAAVALVAKQNGIDSRRVFVAGHSLGAYLAPRIATGDPQITGIVMLAANTRPMEQLLVDQVHYIISSGPAATADEQKQIDMVEANAKKIESPDLKPGDTVTVLGSEMPASYWLDLRDYHPVPVAQALKIPILIMQGGRDFQVPPATNFDEWKTALAARKNVTFKLYPALNHIFITGAGPSMPQEYDKPGHVDEQVITDIASWVSSGGETPHLSQSR